MNGSALSSELVLLYAERKNEIRQRLTLFSNVSPNDWFYELCYCLLTPQSSALHADSVVQELRRVDFQHQGQDVVDVLRNPKQYIRFHNTKHHRIHTAREQWSEIEEIIMREGPTAMERRDILADTIHGFGLKEASHFLRNIGVRGLAIIDRHLLTNLLGCKVFTDAPQIASRKNYHLVEYEFMCFSEKVGIDMDELDLLFWCNQTGFILK